MTITKQIFCFFLTLSSLGAAAQQNHVDFKTAHVHVTPNFSNKSVAGKVIYTFEVAKKPDTVFLDARALAFTQVKINGKPANFIATDKQLKLFSKFKKGKNNLEIEYTAQPKQTVYFIGTPNQHQIWTQGQGKYTSHWLPSFDDVNEKVIFNLSVSYPETYQVTANGQLKDKQTHSGITTWNYEMQHPMSSYLVMFAIGDYVKKNAQSSQGTPLEFYLKSEDSLKFESTYAYSKEIFDFLESEIGIPYPWGVYRQIPVDDFLYSGMENTTATVFSQDFVVDAIGATDKKYLNVNAHELAHQWFGDLVTAKENKHHWLQEGFATYYALLAEREIYGNDYFDFELYNMAEQIILAQKNDTEPILSENASSLTFYKKGAWALHYLKNQIGADNFNQAVRNFVEKYQFKNATTDDFLVEVSNVVAYNTTDFKKRWLESSEFHTQDAFKILTQNPAIVTYLEIGGLYDTPLPQKQEKFKELLQSDAYITSKVEAIYQLGKEKPENVVEFFPIITASNHVKLRQAFVLNLAKVAPEHKNFYLQFLDDASYITQEIVLKNAWVAFPEDRIPLLTKTQNWYGFNDKNLRIAWLTLALITHDFQPELKLKHYDELLQFTQPGNESATRQNALTNLLYINPNDTNALAGLVQGLNHHKWQFVKFCKVSIRLQIKTEKYRKYYTDLLPQLENTALKNSLEKILKEQPSN